MNALLIKDLLDAQDRQDIPGGFALAVIKDGDLVFNNAYGYANNEHNIPISSSSVFDFASVAKQFTGFAIATLIEQSKIRLDDDVHKYIPELPDFGSIITIGHLLYHTSGIRDWLGLVKLSGRNMGDIITKDLLFKIICNQEDLNFKSGEEFRYSNSGYFLLAIVISRVTKKTFRKWCHENIFQPSEMTNTFFRDTPNEIIKSRASSYIHNGNKVFVNSSNLLTSCGSSSLFSTMEDMIKWVKNYETKLVGSKAVWEMMTKKGNLNNGKEIEYGFGLGINNIQGRLSYSHGGSWAGFLCDIRFYPKERVSYVLMINREPPEVNISNELDIILFDIKADEEVHTKSEKDSKKDKKRDKVFSPQEYIGKFYNPENRRTIHLESREENLLMHFVWKTNVKAFQQAQDLFFIEEENMTFKFTRDGTSSVNQLCEKYGDRITTYNKISSDISKMENSDEYIGEYYSRELKTVYTIVIKKNRLIVEHLQNEDVHLLNYSENGFISENWWFQELSFLRNSENEITGFFVNADNTLVENLFFKKKK